MGVAATGCDVDERSGVRGNVTDRVDKGVRAVSQESVGHRGRHWHVSVTVGGPEVEPLLMRAALMRLAEEHPFLTVMRFHSTSAQLEYWDESPSMSGITDLALNLWREHRESAGLPDWEVLALAIRERTVSEEHQPPAGRLLGGQELHPMHL